MTKTFLLIVHTAQGMIHTTYDDAAFCKTFYGECGPGSPAKLYAAEVREFYASAPVGGILDMQHKHDCHSKCMLVRLS